MVISKKDDNALVNYGLYKNEKLTLKEQKIEKDYRDLIDKILNIRSYIKDGLLEYTP